jgi:hypothetical protein
MEKQNYLCEKCGLKSFIKFDEHEDVMKVYTKFMMIMK